MDRVDGRLKVTGGAKYFADHQLPGLTYGCLVCSTIAKGTIKKINSQKATAAPGVLGIVSYLNAPNIKGYQENVEAKKNGVDKSQELRIFKDNKIYSNGQPLAMIVADTLERAVYAASLVTVDYTKEASETDLSANIKKGVSPGDDADYTRGDPGAIAKAPIKFEADYTSPTEVHNPMELAGIIANWEGNKLVVYAKTQGVKDHQKSLAKTFGLPVENIQVNSEFVGGAFGMALRVWPHEIATIVAAKKFGKPVKLVLARDQMFTMVGYRPQAAQKIKLGASEDGKLIGIYHEAAGITSTYESFNESVASVSRGMYACPNVSTKYRMVGLNVGTPIWMRGPGEATGAFALESALDELSYILKKDPVELRVINNAETDPESGKPFSNKYLKEAYEIGADKIGWKNRSAVPRSQKEGDYFVGYGMATGRFGAYRDKATAATKFLLDGSLEIRCGRSGYRSWYYYRHDTNCS